MSRLPNGYAAGGPPNSTTRVTGGPFAVSGQVFAGDLSQAPGASKRARHDVIAGLQPNKMQALANGEKAALTNRNNQVGTGPASFLSGHVVPEDEAGPYEDAQPTHMGSHLEYVNTAIPVVRFLASPHAYELPGDRQLVFIKKMRQRAQRMAARLGRPDTSALTRTVNNTTMRTLAYEYTDSNSIVGKHMEALNNFIIRCQYDLFEKDPQRYERLTPSELWHGVSDLSWSGWTLDGVCRLEELTGGKSTKFDDGYGSMQSLGRLSKGVGREGVEKTMSVVRAGRVSMHNFFNSRLVLFVLV
jgi:hypothetical protein